MQFEMNKNKIFYFIVLTIVLSCNLKKEFQNKMTYNSLSPHTDTTPHFYPVQFAVTDLFETALPHTIATNDFADEITLLHLEDECKIEHLPSNGVTSGGGICPTPLYSNEWIAYGQTRGFERYNVKTHEFFDQIVCTKLEEVLSACRALDPTNNIFVFMIANLEKPGSIRTRFFKVFDLTEKKPKLLSKLEAGDYQYEDLGTRFVTRDSTLFYVHETENKLIALDFNLQPTSHPFADAYNEHLEMMMETSHITVHPTLPFALVVSTVPGVVSWKDGKRDFTPLPYMKKDFYASGFSFSQDGKMLAWCSESTEYPTKEPPVYWVAKIDERIPGYIGIPIRLGSTFSKFPGKTECTAWASEPYTYIVSEMEGLFWWHIE